MADPTRKEIEAIRKRIDSLNRQLKPLGQSCIKKVEKERAIIILLSNDFKPLII